jgi:hypothetical protein
MLGCQTVYTLFTGRSGQWPKVRDEHLAKFPKCACCNRIADTVHHLIPVAVAPMLELDPNNFASVCDKCHLCIGHCGNFRLWNTLFWQTAGMLNKGRRGPVGEIQ